MSISLNAKVALITCFVFIANNMRSSILVVLFSLFGQPLLVQASERIEMDLEGGE